MPRPEFCPAELDEYRSDRGDSWKESIRQALSNRRLGPIDSRRATAGKTVGLGTIRLDPIDIIRSRSSHSLKIIGVMLTSEVGSQKLEASASEQSSGGTREEPSGRPSTVSSSAPPQSPQSSRKFETQTYQYTKLIPWLIDFLMQNMHE